MKKCPRCKKDHDEKSKFCSRSCANTREHTAEAKAKIAESLKKTFASWTPEQKQQYKETMAVANASPERVAKLQATAKRKFDAMAWEDLCHESKRTRILEEQNNTCTCGISSWLGQPLTLDIDHINGDSQDNRRENLVALCPNCHSLTPTYRGKNKGRRIPENEFVEALNSNLTIRQALLSLKVAAKGGNYERAKYYLAEGKAKLRQKECTASDSN